MAEMNGSVAITLGMLGLFFALIVFVLYATNRQANTFSDYAVGGRSFGSWYIAMSYTNSWWPGATYTAFFGLSVSAGVLGFYALAYSLLGVTAMYLMAERAWLWGKRYDLRTQPDMMGLRFDSRAVRVTASAIGVVCLFPWIVLGMQAGVFLIQGGYVAIAACHGNNMKTIYKSEDATSAGGCNTQLRYQCRG